MEQLMKIGNPKYCNTVSKTDRYGKSIEHLLSQYPDTEFLITPSADGWLVSAVSTIVEEKPEAEVKDANVERVSGTGSGKPKESRRKSSRRTKR